MNPNFSIPTNFSHSPNQRKSSGQQNYPQQYNLNQKGSFQNNQQPPYQQPPYQQPPYQNNGMYQQQQGLYPQQDGLYQNQNQNQQNLQPQSYQPGMYNMNSMSMQLTFAKQIINQFADQIFEKHDGNYSGQLDVNEIYPAVCEVFLLSKKQPPSYNQCLQIMQSFDADGNGLIDKMEFREILLKFGTLQFILIKNFKC